MHPGKILIIIGLISVGVGLLLLYGGKVPTLGRLPGDIRIEKENYTLFIPLGTSLLLSVVISLFFWLFRR